MSKSFKYLLGIFSTQQTYNETIGLQICVEHLSEGHKELLCGRNNCMLKRIILHERK